MLARGEQDEERRAVRLRLLARHGGGLRRQGHEGGGGAQVALKYVPLASALASLWSGTRYCEGEARRWRT